MHTVIHVCPFVYQFFVHVCMCVSVNGVLVCMVCMCVQVCGLAYVGMYVSVFELS